MKAGGCLAKPECGSVHIAGLAMVHAPGETRPSPRSCGARATCSVPPCPKPPSHRPSRPRASTSRSRRLLASRHGLRPARARSMSFTTSIRTFTRTSMSSHNAPATRLPSGARLTLSDLYLQLIRLVLYFYCLPNHRDSYPDIPPMSRLRYHYTHVMGNQWLVHRTPTT